MLEALFNIVTSFFAWGFVAGLVIGWNFIPQPSWVAKWFKKD
jgi:hypothetical protein